MQDSDDEAEYEEATWEGVKAKTTDVDWDSSFHEAETTTRDENVEWGGVKATAKEIDWGESFNKTELQFNR